MMVHEREDGLESLARPTVIWYEAGNRYSNVLSPLEGHAISRHPRSHVPEQEHPLRFAAQKVTVERPQDVLVY